MNKIIELLHTEQCSCVISKGEETRVFNQKGIARPIRPGMQMSAFFRKVQL